MASYDVASNVCLALYHGVVCQFYDLVPDRGWEVDLDSVRRVANASTAGAYKPSYFQLNVSIFLGLTLAHFSPQRKHFFRTTDVHFSA
jgi:hypothetical protein